MRFGFCRCYVVGFVLHAWYFDCILVCLDLRVWVLLFCSALVGLAFGWLLVFVFWFVWLQFCLLVLLGLVVLLFWCLVDLVLGCDCGFAFFWFWVWYGGFACG